MDKTKRRFLKTAGGVMASMSLPMSALLSNHTQAAIVPNAKKLVVLTILGGNDGVNTVIPLDTVQYANYRNLRPDIGLEEAAILPLGTTANNVALGLHPSLSSLIPLRDKLAVFPATHSGPFSNTSHFFQYEFFGAGQYVGNIPLNDNKGWLGRFLDTKYTQDPEGIVAFDFATGRYTLTRGDTFTLGLSNPANIGLGTTATRSTSIWEDVRAVFASDTGQNTQPYAAEQARLFDAVLPRLRGVDFSRIPSVTYPSNVGTQLKRTVDMFKSLPELEVVHVTIGGFDTHRNQVVAADTTTGAHANLLRQLGDALAAFYADLAEDPALLNNVVLVTQTEFGRTAAQNENLGTDHAQASAWFALGEGVQGGIYGDYPGLALSDLEGGRYFRQTVDYRDVLSEVLGPKFMGATQADANAVFAGYSGAATPLNFIV